MGGLVLSTCRAETGGQFLIHERVPSLLDIKEFETLTTKTKRKPDAPTKAPSHLSADSKAFFEYVTTEYFGFDQHHIRSHQAAYAILRGAWDRAV